LIFWQMLFNNQEVNFTGSDKKVAQVYCIFGLFTCQLSDIKNTFELCH
jgi:hypothetical protein